MAATFLTAEWKNLIMANYEVDPSVLKKYVPFRTELDEFNGVHYVSLVAFLFKDTRVKGIGFPFHRTFEEVNLRFYVRYKEGQQWKRGTVFIKEIVPKRMITFVANTIYKENYATHQMKHHWSTIEDELRVEYYWKAGGEWNYIKATAEKTAAPLITGSEEEFITEHYWGYTFTNQSSSGVYEVAHPKWNIHKVRNYEILCNAAKLYGKEFTGALNEKPKSVFLADGSPVKVLSGGKVYIQ